MTKTYLKRIAAPKTWAIARRTSTFITRPKPSGHALEHTLPMSVILRDYLGVATSARQADRILKGSEVLVNGRTVRTLMDGAGFMDVVTINKHAYRVLIDANTRLVLVPVKKGEDAMIRKLLGKTSRGAKSVQLNLTGGMNLLVEKAPYAVGDSLVLKDGKVAQHLPLAPGASVFVTGGGHIGTIGVVREITGNTITVEADGTPFRTTKAYTYVIGKETPLITLG